LARCQWLPDHAATGSLATCRHGEERGPLGPRVSNHKRVYARLDRLIYLKLLARDYWVLPLPWGKWN
jgi:hypothetical protein